jgi:hypothetical protein
MRFDYRHELMKQNLLAPDYAETSTYFHGGNGNGENAVAAGVHKILVLTFACFETWLKPLFSQGEERQNPSPIHEYDPYVVGLMRYLQSQRRN